MRFSSGLRVIWTGPSTRSRDLEWTSRTSPSSENRHDAMCTSPTRKRSFPSAPASANRRAREGRRATSSAAARAMARDLGSRSPSAGKSLFFGGTSSGSPAPARPARPATPTPASLLRRLLPSAACAAPSSARTSLSPATSLYMKERTPGSTRGALRGRRRGGCRGECCHA